MTNTCAGTIFDPMLKAAHDHAFDTREAVNAGGACGCFCCLRTFPAIEITHWQDNNNTALCPYCHTDSVLSGNVDPIDQTFLTRMHKAWFDRKVKRPDIKQQDVDTGQR